MCYIIIIIFFAPWESYFTDLVSEIGENGEISANFRYYRI